VAAGISFTAKYTDQPESSASFTSGPGAKQMGRRLWSRRPTTDKNIEIIAHALEANPAILFLDFTY